MAVNQIVEVAPERLSKCRFIIEGTGRNTAPAITLAALAATDDVLLVTPADHLIVADPTYAQNIATANELAKNGHLVTFGISPTSPTSEYGYIETISPSGDKSGSRSVAHFHEKPDLATAKQYIEKGGYYWNSGMFVFSKSRFLEEMQTHSPEILKSAQRGWDAHSQDPEYTTAASDPLVSVIPQGAMLDMPSESIDTALFEKSRNVMLVPAEFTWSDVGGFNALHDAKSLDNNAAPVSIKTKNNFVHSHSNKLVATLGVENLNIIDTPDALLIASKSHMQDMRQLYDEVKATNQELVDYHVTSQRPWGSYTVLNEGPGYKVKRIEILPKKRLSLQRHTYRAEHWVVVSGTAKVTIDTAERSLDKNESTYIPIGAVHRLENPGTDTLVIIEVQSGERVLESDIERLEDDYQRI